MLCAGVGKERFTPWKTIDGEKTVGGMTQLEVLLRGMFAKERLLDLVKHFIVFEEDHNSLVKILAAYHQYHAVNKAIESTVEATEGDKRAGVIWHTQGSGKSLIIAFYTGKLVLKLENPTIVLFN